MKFADIPRHWAEKRPHWVKRHVHSADEEDQVGEEGHHLVDQRPAMVAHALLVVDDARAAECPHDLDGEGHGEAEHLALPVDEVVVEVVGGGRSLVGGHDVTQIFRGGFFF